MACITQSAYLNSYLCSKVNHMNKEYILLL